MKRMITGGLILTAFCGIAILTFGNGCGQLLPTGTPSPVVTATPTATPSPTPVAFYDFGGTVLFSSTSSGVKGGVTLTLSSATVTKVATADSTLGTFSFTSLEAGTYSVEAKKTNWDTTSETFSIVADSTDSNIRLYPTSWEVVHYDTSMVLNAMTIGSPSAGIFQGKAIAVGNDGVIIYSTAASGYKTWTGMGAPTSTDLSGIDNGGGSADLLAVYGKASTSWSITREGDSWGSFLQVTSDANSSISQIDGYFLATYQGKRYLRVSGAGFDVYSDKTPSGAAGKVNDFLFYSQGISRPSQILVGDNGYSIHTQDSTTWISMPNLSSVAAGETLTGVAQLGNNLYVVSTSGKLFLSEDISTGNSLDTYTWQEVLSGIPIQLNAFMRQQNFSSGELFIVGNDGLILRKKS